MTDREKLLELLADKCSFRDNPCKGCECMAIASKCREEVFGEVADHLIANGVVVNNWRDAKTDPPNNDLRVLVTVKANVDSKGGRMDTDRMHNGRWVRWEHLVSKWQPLPEPPKEATNADAT